MSPVEEANVNKFFSAKRLKTGALDAKLLAILRKQVPVTPNQRRRAIKAGFGVGSIMHSPVGTRRSVPYPYFYMRRGEFVRFLASTASERGRTQRGRRKS